MHQSSGPCKCVTQACSHYAHRPFWLDRLARENIHLEGVSRVYLRTSVLPAYSEDMDAALGCRGHQESALGIRPGHTCDWVCDVAPLGIQQVQKQRLPVLSLVSAVDALH